MATSLAALRAMAETPSYSATRVLIYGPPKTGKTAIAASLANAGFTLHWVDLERGFKTIFKHVKEENLERINYMQIPDHRMNPVGVDAVRDILLGREVKFCYAHGKKICGDCLRDKDALWGGTDISKFTPKDILVIDSASQLANSCMAKVTKDGLKSAGEEYKYTFNDFGQQGMITDILYSNLQARPINSLIISHEVEAETTGGKDMIVPVCGTRNASKIFGKYFDEVIRVGVVNGKFRLYNSPTASPTALTGGRGSVILDDLKDEALIAGFAKLFGG